TISDTAVLDSLPDPIMMVDRAGNILGANLSARTLFGENVTAKTVEKLFASQSFIRATFKVLNKESEAENLIFYIKKPRSQKLYAHIK
ncbi:MAG: PAS domain-containing protein, partial [Alphaproteobacteria bacterium]|nr:PAS domain-containing protein [Alphaproteobacteria bacterium]